MVSYANTNALSMLGGDSFDEIIADIAALDATVVHKTGSIAESIDGEKTFTDPFTVNATTAIFNLSQPFALNAFSIISPLVNLAGGYIEVDNLEINTNIFRITGTADCEFLSNLTRILDINGIEKIRVDSALNTTSITDDVVNITAANQTTIASGTTSLISAGTGNNLIRATAGNLVKLQNETDEKMTLSQSVNLQSNTQINTDAVTSHTDKIGGVEKMVRTSALTTNTNATITNVCSTAFRVQTVSGTDKLNIGAALTTATNATITNVCSTKFAVQAVSGTDILSMTPASFTTNPSGNNQLRVNSTTKVLINATETTLTNGTIIFVDSVGTERFRQTSSLTTLTNTNHNVVGILNSTSYTVGTAASNVPLCSIQYQVRRDMGTTTGTKIGFYQANWNSSFTNSTISNLLGFKPYGYELLLDNGTAIVGTATTATIIIDVFNSDTSTIIGTATTSSVTLNNTTAQRFRGVFTSTASLAAGVDFQIRFQVNLTSGTMTTNVKGLTCNVYCQQI